jgi:hypothetical protein
MTLRHQAETSLARDAETVGRIVRRLLKGAHLTAVFITGDFRLEFSRSDAATDVAPPVAYLTLRSDWWIGDRDQWEGLLNAPVVFPAPSEVKREAMKAYAIVCLYRGGAEVEDIALSDDGTLVLSTSMGALAISGREDVFEESWILDVPPGVPGHDLWSVVCTNTGELFGRQPAS